MQQPHQVVVAAAVVVVVVVVAVVVAVVVVVVVVAVVVLAVLNYGSNRLEWGKLKINGPGSCIPSRGFASHV
jgi:hypothetical protein